MFFYLNLLKIWTQIEAVPMDETNFEHYLTSLGNADGRPLALGSSGAGKWKMIYHQDLKKQGDLRNSLVLLGVTVLWHVAQWVSRAPPHHTLPAFLNLNGIFLRLSRDMFLDSSFWNKNPWAYQSRPMLIPIGDLLIIISVTIRQSRPTG